VVNDSSKLMAQTEKLYESGPQPGAMSTLARNSASPIISRSHLAPWSGSDGLVLMDDWLGRSGPLGAILGFALGEFCCCPSVTFMAQWVQRLPDAAGVRRKHHPPG